MTKEKKILVFIVTLFGVLLICGQRNEGKLYIASPIGKNSPPQIDGILDDMAWQKTEWKAGFTQSIPYDGSLPSQQTSFKILYHIYYKNLHL